MLDQPYKVKARQMPTLLSIPLADGEDEASHDRHVKMLKSECKKVNPSKMVYGELMKRTFAFRRQMVMENIDCTLILAQRIFLSFGNP